MECNISLFLASRFFFIFRSFGINFQSLYLNVVSMVSSIAYRRSGTCRNIIALLNIIYDEEISHELQWNITYMCDEEQVKFSIYTEYAKVRKKTDAPLECQQLELFL
ncbi:hypothetical protein T03_11937 [Trichinella britovi]|uniref:Uncharacterized protein n=1 Tax=Trichinella britovi TaxID=45882 RepID=A0A0V1C441_TRIBR|nr:hypothetical protein T03_306 [Trichinella britovi]KRY44229.1 hypothetical protein T03_11937 [Trichinella britovi]